MCVRACICAVSEEILPCFLCADTVQQHLGDYLSLRKGTVSVSLGQTSQKSAAKTHTHTHRHYMRIILKFTIFQNTVSQKVCFTCNRTSSGLMTYSARHADWRQRMETCSYLPECSISSPCLPPLTLPPLAPPILYLMQEQTHLLYHDASLPPSALSRCWNWQEINPALIYKPRLLLSFLHCPLPPSCKVSSLDRVEASAQHHGLSEQAHCSSVSASSSLGTLSASAKPPHPTQT